MNLTLEQKEEIRQRILDFNDWEWCNCSECKCDARSHAVNTTTSLERLADFVVDMSSQCNGCTSVS